MDINISLNSVLYLITAITSIVAFYKLVKKEFKTIVHNIANEGMSEQIKKVISESIPDTSKDLKIIKKTLQDSIRQNIVNKYNECTEKNYISEYDMYAVNQLLSDYTNLEGNTFVEDLVQELRDLRSKSAQVDKQNGKTYIKK